jgi:hypothetical protein
MPGRLECPILMVMGSLMTGPGPQADADWPDIWPWDWDEELDLPREVEQRDAPSYRAAAHHAAVERWTELLFEHRSAEPDMADEADAESEAVRLVELLRRDLPAGMTAGRDGPRAYLRDRNGREWTIGSVQDAWRVVAEYDERHTR